MGASVRPVPADPLAEYTPDWRTRAASGGADPLADYTPGWRQQPTTPRIRAPQVAPAAPIENSPFADSIYALTGRPAAVRRVDDPYPVPGEKKALGYYDPNRDEVRLAKDVATRGPAEMGATERHVFTHEMGHRINTAPLYRAAPSPDPALRAAFDRYTASHPGEKPSGYAANGRGEWFSEAFADAVDALQSSAGDASIGRDALHARLARTPGAAAVADELLKRPIYAAHPLNTTLPPVRAPQTAPTGEIAPADATARIAGTPSLNLRSQRLTGPAKLASDVFQAGADAVSHPLSTAASIVTAPLQSAARLGAYTSQQVHRVPGAPTITGREALESGAQLAATALAGPVEGALERRIGGMAAKAATGAGVGAVFMPEQPGVGAILGAAGGAAADRVGAHPSAPDTPAFDQHAAKVADLVDQVRQGGAEGRQALELAWSNAIADGDHPTAGLLREVWLAHDALPKDAAPLPVAPEPEAPTSGRIAAPAETPRAAATAAEPVSAEPSVTPEPPANPYAHLPEPPRVYHGSSAAFETFDPAKLDPGALYGPGYYFTENPSVASEYVAKGTAVPTTGVTAYSAAQERLELNQRRLQSGTLDPDGPSMTESQRSAVERAVRQDQAVIDRLLAGNQPNVRPARVALAQPFDIDRRMSVPDGLSIIGRLGLDKTALAEDWRRAATLDGHTVSGAGIYEALVKEYGSKATANDVLRLAGYDGITHTGGGVVGDVPHKVTIAFDKAQIRSPWGEWKGATMYSNPIGPALAAAPRIVDAGVRAVWNAHGVATMRDAFNRVLDPAGRSPEAERAGTVLRAQTGAMARSFEQTSAALHAASRAFDGMPEAERLAFIDRVETGKPQPTPELQQAHDTMRGAFDTTRDQIRALGTGKLDHFIADYFPHVWDDPAAAKQVFGQAMGKRPMQGSRSFLKQRTIPTTADGIAAGLTPVTTNPVDLTLLKLREMQRYLMAHTALQEMQTKGLVQYVKAGAPAPDGYARINDDIATVFGPKTGAVSLPAGANVAPNDVTVFGRRVMGQYYAPEPVARVVNNYLSPGLRGNALFDAYRLAGNTLNQAQLGLSAFHLGFTSMDAAVSRVALGIEQGAHGKPLAALKSLASAPGAPVTNALKGRRIRAEYLKPGSQGADVGALAQAVADAGGRVTQDTFYATAATEFRRAVQNKQYVRAGVRLFPALLEKTMAPIMEHVVPMQKLGVFGDLAKEALSQLPPGATDDVRRATLAKVWDSVDNRMGQLVYDNLFWDKTVKDLAMGSMRSVGWNVGTGRELGGGALDFVKAAGALARGQRPELTHRMAYVAALPIAVGTLGAVVNTLMTGEPPQELKDYFFPRTGTFDADGNPNRVSLPSYMKDVMAYAGHPWQTVKHKLAPVLSLVGEMLNNEDFYGDQIRNPDDPLVQQLQQEATYLGKSALPFALRNAQEGTKRGASLGEKSAAFVGVTPASRETVRSDAQNKLAEYTGATMPSGASPEDADARGHRADVLGALRGRGDLDAAVRTAVDAGQLDDAQLQRLEARAQLTPMQERFKALPLEKAMRVFDLADDREKALLAEVLQAKIAAAQHP